MPYLLIVDDEPLIRELVVEMAGVLGWSAEAKASAVEALESLKTGEQKPDLVLSDQNMPKMNGDQLLAEVRSDSSLGYVYFALMTGGADIDRDAALLERGCDGFLRKPFTIDDLEELLEAFEPG